MHNTKELDQWEENLEEVLKELNSCQMNLFGTTSCKPNDNYCEQFFECELRKKYVIAVYESMSKGSGGGFEF